jgi:hypothetical protein
MSTNNNIPTDGVTFSPAEPSEIPSIIADVEFHSAYESGDPARAVDELMFAMAPQRLVMMDIMRACADAPMAMDELKDYVDELQVYEPSVYTAADMCALLEEAGALAKMNADGTPYDTSSLEPSIVEEDGVRYYLANEPADLYWQLEDAGRAWLDGDDPVARAQGFFDDDPDLLPLYARVLELCGAAKGATLAELEEAVNDDPLVQSPRVYAPFFIDRLERCDAIRWHGTWQLSYAAPDVQALLEA